MSHENDGYLQISADQFVDRVFTRAVEARASDVHIEPTKDSVHIRFRIDGTLQDQGTIPKESLEHIITKMKVLSALDIAERIVPQDGHFEIDVSKGPDSPEMFGVKTERIIDVRVSFFSTVNGEAAVCRLLNRSESVLTIDQLGFDEITLLKVRSLITRSYGMLLVTGPTGAGKTTTLYSILRETMGSEKSIVTLEDPVEFRFDTVRQTQMQPERGLTFAVGMKSILRQDPDIIMIGEIRDRETAEHAVRASLVGRIVFSTIHSNTTIGTIARLIDMNVERSLIAYALNGVMSTRLVRKNCEHCRVSYTPEAAYLKDFQLPEGATFMKGAGCDKCKGKGHSGRIGVFEVLEFDHTIREMIIDKASMGQLQEYVERSGMKTLRQDALDKVLRGVTTLEAVAHEV